MSKMKMKFPKIVIKILFILYYSTCIICLSSSSTSSSSSYYPFMISNRTLNTNNNPYSFGLKSTNFKSSPFSSSSSRKCPSTYPNPCQNNGICFLDSQTHKPYCRCQSGPNGVKFVGPNCEYQNPCLPTNPCFNDGKCGTILNNSNQPPSFKCKCPLGFTSSLCEEEEPNVCLRENPCENGGKCVLKGNLENFECFCSVGWSGPRCTEPDSCASYPCQNGGTCKTSGLNGTTTFTCDCIPGFTGSTCGEDIDECRELGPAIACHHNGYCLNTPGSYKCKCNRGFTGEFCENRYVPCENVNPCQNQGKCIPNYQNSTHQCLCPAGFSGPNCEVNIDDCFDGNLCQNGGICVDGIRSYSCACPGNFTGTYCEEDVDECFGKNPCQHGGTCVNLFGGFNCICVNGWTGATCGDNIDDCSQAQCYNGGTCHDRVGSFYCECPPGKTGLLCHLEDACASNPCFSGAICDTNPRDGTYVCSCPPGFNGTDCTEDIDECRDSGSPCEHSGTCVNTPGSYRCDCPLGFTGARCEVNINECESNPCQNDGTCLDEIRGSYRCLCMPGYSGVHCESRIIDESNYVTEMNLNFNLNHCDENPCRNSGTCYNEAHTYSCTCANGFTGRNCENDIDDCQPNPCLNQGKCIDQANSFRCECNSGFMGLVCQQRINHCESNPCFNQGKCHDFVNQYRCQCPSGFHGEHCEIDINECQPNPCQNQGFCIESGIGPNYTCNCAPGFSGDACEVDIDECASNPCENGGICQDRVNGFYCACATGFNGSICNQKSNTVECDGNDCENKNPDVNQIPSELSISLNVSVTRLNGTFDPNSSLLQQLLDLMSKASGSILTLTEIQATSFGSRLIITVDCRKVANQKCKNINYLADFFTQQLTNPKSQNPLKEFAQANGLHMNVAPNESRKPDIRTTRFDGPDFTYIVLVCSLLGACIILVTVFYCNTGAQNNQNQKNKKLVTGITWFPQGFQAPGSSRSSSSRPRRESSVISAAGQNFIRRNHSTLTSLHCTNSSIRSGSPDGQEMRKIKSRDSNLRIQNQHQQDKIYEEPYVDNRIWTRHPNNNRIQENPITPPLQNLDQNFVDLPGPNGFTPLMTMMINNADYSMINTNSINDNPTESSEDQIVQYLLHCGANPNLVCDRTLETSLHLAARYARADAAKRLIQNCADVNAQDVSGRTPLHTAIASDARGVFEILLSNRTCNLNAKAYDGMTPLMLSARMANEGMVAQLLAHQAELNTQDNYGKTALHWAASVNNTEAVQSLLQYGADRDAKNLREETPLFLAAREGAFECAKLLLDYYANRDIPDHMERLPLDVAEERYHMDIVELLEKYKPEIDPSKLRFVNLGYNSGSLENANSNSNKRSNTNKSRNRKPPQPKPNSILFSANNNNNPTTNATSTNDVPPTLPPRNNNNQKVNNQTVQVFTTSTSSNTSSNPVYQQINRKPIFVLGSIDNVELDGSMIQPSTTTMYGQIVPQMDTILPFTYLSPPNSMNSTARISPPSKLQIPTYEEAIYYKQQQQPLAVVTPRSHVMMLTSGGSGGQPPTPIGTPAPSNGYIRYSVTGHQMVHPQNHNQRPPHSLESYPTPSPDSWGSLSSSSPLSDSWTVGGAMDNGGGTLIVHGQGGLV